MPMRHNHVSAKTFRAVVEQHSGLALQLDRAVCLIEQIGGHEFRGHVYIFTSGCVVILARVAKGAAEPRNMATLRGPHSYLGPIIAAILKHSGCGD